MPNRFQKTQHELAYKFIAARDGEYCLSCYKGPRAKLEIDHMDNDISNWNPDNLHLFCQKHNLKMRALEKNEKLRTIGFYIATNEQARERMRGQASTEVVREMVDYRAGTPEMQANSYYETKFRDWLLAQINAAGFIIKEEAIYSGAEFVGCSPTTIQRYLKKLTSQVGPLTERKDATGTVVCVFRARMSPRPPVTKDKAADTTESSRTRGAGSSRQNRHSRPGEKDGTVADNAKGPAQQVASSGQTVPLTRVSPRGGRPPQ